MSHIYVRLGIRYMRYEIPSIQGLSANQEPAQLSQMHGEEKLLGIEKKKVGITVKSKEFYLPEQ
ncbi:hypothetical protein HI914_00090 [Erysiphe necator]|nr:hypothetical protein HI914_00090 [Erysiphe necator]